MTQAGNKCMRHDVPMRPPRTLLVANPPFLRSHMDALEPKLRELLRSTRDAVALCVVPAQSARSTAEAPHCQALLASPLTRGFVELAAHEHVFCSGISHRQTLKASYAMPSSHATSVVVMASCDLSSDSVSQLLEGVREAFRPPSNVPPSNHRPRRARRPRRPQRPQRT